MFSSLLIACGSSFFCPDGMAEAADGECYPLESTNGAVSDPEEMDTETTAGSLDGGETSSESNPCPYTGMVTFEMDGQLKCVDAYELTVLSGDIGDKNQCLVDVREPSDIVVVSEPYRISTPRVSFLQWMVICEQRGLYLMTISEWAAIIADEAKYPYGDVYQDNGCATPDASYDETNSAPPTDPSDSHPYRPLVGAWPECHTTEGIYDPLGGQWQWLDSEQVHDTAASLANLMRQGVNVWSGPNNEVQMDPEAANSLSLSMQGVTIVSTSFDEDGTYNVEVSTSWDFEGGGNPGGYLNYDQGEGGDTNILNTLLVELVPNGATSKVESFRAHFRLAEEMDNCPRAYKIGGAFYPGTGPVEFSLDPQTEHPPYFDGDVVAQCVGDPIY